MPTPQVNETEQQFISRCIPQVLNEGTASTPEQAFAVCRTFFSRSKSKYNTKSIKEVSKKISFDFDGVLTTKKGTELAIRKKEEGNRLYIISARHHMENMFDKADQIGIPHSRIYATGSNKRKVERVIELNIDIHFDTNQNVVNELPNVGRLFKND